MKTLIKYEFVNLFKTQKFVIILGVFVFFSLLSPITAYYLPELIKNFGTQDGITIIIEDPTVYNSYEQFVSNIQTVVMVIIFLSVSNFISDKTKGLYPLLLSKPISRTKYILSKLISLFIIVLVSLIIGSMLFALYTYLLFQDFYITEFLFSTSLTVVYIIYIFSICLFFSVFSNTYLKAILFSFLTFIFMGVFSSINLVVFKYLPDKLIGTQLLIYKNLQDNEVILISLFVTLLISLVLIFFSLKKFKDQEI